MGTIKYRYHEKQNKQLSLQPAQAKQRDHMVIYTFQNANRRYVCKYNSSQNIKYAYRAYRVAPTQLSSTHIPSPTWELGKLCGLREQGYMITNACSYCIDAPCAIHVTCFIKYQYCCGTATDENW